MADQSLFKAHLQGHWAHADNKRLTDNPYAEGTEEHRLWKSGWNNNAANDFADDFPKDNT